ncbi:hypothetical protein BS47DRAFT_1396243 [Hydnum rufescens UP504]|uniref:Uncharacterized protein n=1 Tax=Hydnum rufescens UP504 TaxID=1448309 RepID=A0A9P6AQS1_9AGAM|nr:hypothetical protein BS47DRAFT_1396243 [Hydnum rufescens UP504]
MPFSKNVLGNAPNDQHKGPLYPLLKNNTKNPTIIVFKKFLVGVFKFKFLHDIDLEAIYQDPETLEHLAKFNISLKKSEVEHYQPFMTLVNHILAAGTCQKSSKPSIFTHSHDTFDVHSSSGAIQ